MTSALSTTQPPPLPPAVHIEIVPVIDRGDLESARALFIEYAQSLGFSLCFQGFDHELATLPGRYHPPAGRLLLAKIDSWPVGCIALRGLDPTAIGGPGVCEMKRLYIQPLYRGLGIGRLLARRLIQEAKDAGYTALWLDTTPDMAQARGLYESLGFAARAPYSDKALPGTIFMELAL